MLSDPRIEKQAKTTLKRFTEEAKSDQVWGTGVGALLVGFDLPSHLASPLELPADEMRTDTPPFESRDDSDVMFTDD